MSKLVLDLQTTLDRLDAQAAAKLERLVRDAISLAQPGSTQLGTVDSHGWPLGYWDQFGGCIAGEPWELPTDAAPDSIPA